MAGIYIHIPFCKQKCTYCDFHFSTSFISYQQEMIDAILVELEARKHELAGQRVDTIYFGGGTPSLLTFNQLQSLMQFIQTNFDCNDTIECTLEANPDDITQDVVRGWSELGVNRLSIGIQSFDAQDLKWMNRAHSVEEGIDCIQLAQNAGIVNISLDLMYGLPNMDNNRWLRQIQQAIDLNVKHISAYCLTVEEKTSLHRLVQQKKILPASNEQQGEHFELLVATLSAAGIQQYEISNFAQEGFISQHNSNYWRGVHYLGIGPSAHSFDGSSRSWNIANNKQYIKLVQEGKSWNEREILTPENQFNELLMTGLRTIWGVNLNQLQAISDFSGTFSDTLAKYENKGWLTTTNEKIQLTQEGKLWADAIAQALFI